MPIDTDAIWRQWCTALRGLITGPFDPASQTISFAGTTLLVDLADPIPAISNQMVFQLGNTIPAPSPAYAPQSDLVSTYATFLDLINLGGDPNPNLANQLNLAAGAVTWRTASSFNSGLNARRNLGIRHLRALNIRADGVSIKSRQVHTPDSTGRRNTCW